MNTKRSRSNTAFRLPGGRIAGGLSALLILCSTLALSPLSMAGTPPSNDLSRSNPPYLLHLSAGPGQTPTLVFVQNDGSLNGSREELEGEIKGFQNQEAEDFLKELNDHDGWKAWQFPGTGFQFQGDPAVLSRLWWQSSPFEVASASTGSYLGIGVADVTKQMATKLGLEEARGVVVTAVAEGSPAEKAGLKVKDVLVAYNGNRLEGRQQLTRMVGETPAERTVKLSIVRGGSPMDVSLTTAARRLNPELRAIRSSTLPGRNLFILPDLPRMVSIYRSPMLGIETEALNEQMAAFFGVKEGVLVREVIPESPAAIAGLKAGDVVISLAGESVSTPADITSILRAKAKLKDGLDLTVVRNQKKAKLTITPSGEWTEGRYFPDDKSESTWTRKE